MEIQIEKVSVQAPVDWLTWLVWCGRQKGIWDNRLTRSQSHGMLGYNYYSPTVVAEGSCL